MTKKQHPSALPPDGPLIMKTMSGSQRLVFAANGPALRLGLHIGMTIGKAQALVPEVEVRDAEPEADNAGLDQMALWALQHYSPIVAPDYPDGLVIDITGAAHLRGGEAELLAQLMERVNGFGVEVSAAIADSWGAAHALARYGREYTTIVPAGATVPAIAALPVSALRLRAETVRSLRKLGFDTIEEVAAQPRSQLQLRYGPEVGRRLDQAFGREREPIHPIRPTELVEVRRSFAEPISLPETIARYTHILVTRLCDALEQRALGARKLDLLFFRIDGGLQAIRIGTAQPMRDVKRLTRLLTDKIETIDPGFGIEVMTLTASLAEPLTPHQYVSALGEAPPPDISELIDVLTNRGEGRLYCIEPVESFVPERSSRKVAPLAKRGGDIWPSHWPRPTILLPKPERIDTLAMLPDYPPGTFQWRGERHRVLKADGPERIRGEWWKRDSEAKAIRDYFRVEDESGRRYWIYRAGDGEDAASGSHQWFLHGLCR